MERWRDGYLNWTMRAQPNLVLVRTDLRPFGDTSTRYTPRPPTVDLGRAAQLLVVVALSAAIWGAIIYLLVQLA